MGVFRMDSNRNKMAGNISPRSVMSFMEDEELDSHDDSSSSTSSSGRSRDKRKRECDDDCLRAPPPSLLSPTLTSSSRVNLRHRSVGHETLAWLAAKDDYATSETTSGEEVLEELWLGPIFENSQTVLSAIATLPTTVTHLDLDLRNALHLLPQAMPMLFHKTHITTLSIRLFGDSGAMELAKWIHLNPNLKRLDLRGNRIGSYGARAIVQALTRCRHGVQEINLSCNCIMEADMIRELLLHPSTRLQHLDLSFNWLGNNEVKELCWGLHSNLSLRELNLFGCQRITGTGLQLIRDCLKRHNVSLHQVHVQTFDHLADTFESQIQHFLALNRAGRYLLRQDVPPSLWSKVLEKSSDNTDALFYLLQQGCLPRIQRQPSA